MKLLAERVVIDMNIKITRNNQSGQIQGERQKVI